MTVFFDDLACRRDDRRGSSKRSTTATQDAGAMVTPLLDRWYSRLAMRHHPDRGGSAQAMAAINDARDQLLRLLADRAA